MHREVSFAFQAGPKPVDAEEFFNAPCIFYS